jgi:hypothetical protein
MRKHLGESEFERIKRLGMDYEVVYCEDGRMIPAWDHVQWYSFILELFNLLVMLQ